MTMRATTNGDVSHLVIEDELSIYTAAEQKDELLQLLNDAKDMEIDLSMVTDMDSAGLQLLILLKQEAEQQGKQLRLLNHSQAVFEIIELLDVSALLGDPVVIPAGWQG